MWPCSRGCAACLRLKHVIDELREREASGRRLGVIEGTASKMLANGARIIIADDNERQARRICDELAVEHRPVVEGEPDKALMAIRARADC